MLLVIVIILIINQYPVYFIYISHTFPILKK
jgi:hypothetical protein